MATYTSKYNLKKPDLEDFADVADLNGNMDIIDETLEKKADLDENGEISKDQLPEMGYISSDDKGQAEGVASLDSSGKVPSAQLPDMLQLKEELLPQDMGDGMSFFINALDVTETGIYWGTAEAYGWNKFPPRSGPFILEAIIAPGGQTMRRVTFTDNGEVYICAGTGSTGWVKI